MAHVLVTGASGFIGEHLLQRLAPKHEVVALSRCRPARGNSSRVTWIEHDLSQPLTPDLTPGPVEAVVHLAQSRNYRDFPARTEEIFDVNVRGTMHLLEFARQNHVKRFVFAGSGGVYQYSSDPIVESGPIQPMGFYLSTKRAAEVLMRNYEAFFSVIGLRLFFVYGPGQQEGMLVPSLLRKVADRQQITIDGDPGIRINPIYVSDAVRAIEAALAAPESFHVNVAGDEVLSITELVDRLGAVVGKSPAIDHKMAGLAGDLVADTTRMKEWLGVTPAVSLRDGLSMLAEGMGIDAVNR